MHIVITQAKGFKTVRIGEEKVTVGEVTPVSDAFIRRLEDEFPSFTFEVVEAGSSNESGDAAGAAGGTGDDKDKGGDA